MQTCACLFNALLVHVSGARHLLHEPSVSGRASVDFTVLIQRTVVKCLYSRPKMPGSKHKSNGDVAGTTVLFKALYGKIKNVLCFLYFYVFVF